GAKVADYYKGELKDFKLEQDVDMGKSHVLKFVEPKLSVQIMAAEEGPSSTNVVLHTEAMQ
ncbi:MAG TPA: hypothetical protein VGL13_13990, partial [Polyangiaceae bacterium]